MSLLTYTKTLMNLRQTTTTFSLVSISEVQGMKVGQRKGKNKTKKRTKIKKNH